MEGSTIKKINFYFTELVDFYERILLSLQSNMAKTKMAVTDTDKICLEKLSSQIVMDYAHCKVL